LKPQDEVKAMMDLEVVAKAQAETEAPLS
jgi:hypothetical protein